MTIGLKASDSTMVILVAYFDFVVESVVRSDTFVLVSCCFIAFMSIVLSTIVSIIMVHFQGSFDTLN